MLSATLFRPPLHSSDSGGDRLLRNPCPGRKQVEAVRAAWVDV